MSTELLRKLLSYVPPKISLCLFGIKFFSMAPGKIIKLRKRVKYYSRNYNNKSLSSNERKKFFRELNKYCVFCNHIGAEEYLDSYFDGENLTSIKTASLCAGEMGSNEPILICCVKNDIVRLKKTFEYHKKIGIRKMVYVDNMSDDGTFEWLKEQDVDLYRIDEKYHAGRKSAWVRKVIDIYGYDRWYLVVDSDEIFTYIGEEEHSVCDLIKYAREKGVERIASFLLDMYSENKLYEKGRKNDFVLDMRYFDSDSYYMSIDGRGPMLRGGPRKRVFESDLDYTEPLSKYPLFFAKIEDIWSDHRPLPFYKNFNSPCISVLRHYKFMEGDYEKYKDIVSKGNYYNGSANYRIYISGGDKLSFMCDKSIEFTDSYSLRKLRYLQEVAWI